MSDYFKHTTSFRTVDSNYLHEPFTKDMLSHDPYTPESIESHSPHPEEKRDELILRQKQSVSPRILKSKLENILKSEKDKEHKKITHTQSEKPFTNLKEEHKKLSHTKSDSRFLGYIFSEHKPLSIIDEITQEHKKLTYTQSDIPPTNLQTRQHKFLSKSQSQNLEKNLEYPQAFRKRCMTEVVRKTSKAKLIGADRAQSITRLQSHHSSSDEEWFEFEEVDVKETTDDNQNDVEVFDAINEVKTEDEAIEVKDVLKEKKIKGKLKIDACCCIC